MRNIFFPHYLSGEPQYNFTNVTRKNFQCQHYPATNSPDKTPYSCYIKKMQPLGCIFLLGYPDSNQE